jgi:dTDP-4-dehydrorhamnose 3,5-epimerase
MFTLGPIDGVIIRSLTAHADQRGWLVELFRSDEFEEQFHPAMCYVSSTEAGVVRGPHAHRLQADAFGFVGPSMFRVYLWDDRPGSTSYRNRLVVTAGQSEPKLIVVPPGVVHAYRNVGTEPGLVINLPNRLYRGNGRVEDVDEIRYENTEAGKKFALD